eukprot:36968-Eustigmatos_ZCMA.PRE.1
MSTRLEVTGRIETMLRQRRREDRASPGLCRSSKRSKGSWLAMTFACDSRICEGSSMCLTMSN